MASRAGGIKWTRYRFFPCPERQVTENAQHSFRAVPGKGTVLDKLRCGATDALCHICHTDLLNYPLNGRVRWRKLSSTVVVAELLTDSSVRPWFRDPKNGGSMKLLHPFASRIITTVCIAAALSSCGDGRKASTLQRPTALLILREAPQLFNGKQKVCDIKTHEVILHVGGWDQKRGDMTIAFLDVLAGVGVLKGKKATDFDGRNSLIYGTYPASTAYSYSIVPQENVDSMYPNTNNEVVLVTLGKPIVKEIVGIRQEGSEAIVDVSFSEAPTPVYEKTMQTGKALFAQCESFPGAKPYFCELWPSSENLVKPETTEFHFVRYDDGWRVVQ
jgi:hypothetical protein